MTQTLPGRQTDTRVQTLRTLFRGLHQFRAAYEMDGISEITDPTGVTWVLWDIEELRHIAVETDLLPHRQRQAIELFLVLNMSEADVAEQMSIRASNPIGMYATSGLTKLLQEIDAGRIPDPWFEDDDESQVN